MPASLAANTLFAHEGRYPVMIAQCVYLSDVRSIEDEMESCLLPPRNGIGIFILPDLVA